MTTLRQFGRFWYDFIVGDDWRIAAAVVVAVGATLLMAHADEPAWFVLPVVVVGVLGSSLWHAARSRRSPPAR